jgi:hypothetical protein
MKNEKLSLFLFCGFGLLLFSQCKQASPELTAKLLGEWKIGYSELDGTANQFMENGYLKFGQKKVETNIFAAQSEYNYSFDGTTLTIEGPEEFIMEANFISNDSLTLSGTIRKFNMVFGLAKAK